MRYKFQIGVQANRTRVYYNPSENPNESECVFMYGNNEQLKTDLLSKIIDHGLRVENMIWIIFGHELGDVYDISKYKVPIPFASGKVFKEYFSWKVPSMVIGKDTNITEFDIYSLAWDIYYSKQLTKQQFIDFIQKKCDDFSIPFVNISHAIEKIDFSRYSNFGNALKKAIEENTPKIFSFSYTDERSKTLVTFILEEIKSIIKYSRLRNNKIHIGVICDQAQWVSKSICSRHALHDILFSWGRTYKVSRYIIQRGEEKVASLIAEEISSKKDGTYSMIFQTIENEFHYLNKINPIKKLGEYDLWKFCRINS